MILLHHEMNIIHTSALCVVDIKNPTRIQRERERERGREREIQTERDSERERERKKEEKKYI